MPRADFYLIDKPRFREQPLLLVCELAKRGFAANLPILVLARDAAQAEAIDDLRWSFDPDEYLPHQIAGMDEGDDETPILIATPEMDVPARAMLINLRDEWPPFFGRFERLIEIVSLDEEDRHLARARYKFYRDRGYQIRTHDMRALSAAETRT